MQVFLIVAVSLDGFIAQTIEQPSTDWTSAEDKQHFHQKTKQAGIIVMGKTTFDTIGKPLPKRLNIIYSYKTKQDLTANYNLTADQTAEDRLRVTSLPPAQLVQQLKKEGRQQLAICGGSSIYTQFIQSEVVDKMFLTVEPVIFGDGIKLFNQPLEQKLTLVNSRRLNEAGTLLLEYDCC